MMNFKNLLKKAIEKNKKSSLSPVSTVALLFICISFLGVGYLMGYHEATGTLPFTPEKDFMPNVETDVTFQEVQDFVASNTTDSYDYGPGFNCVEYAILLARDAHWQGLPAEPAKINYVDGYQHLVLAFPTSDEGWVFIEPQDDSRIYPKVGSSLYGKQVLGVYILRTSWISFEALCQ